MVNPQVTMVVSILSHGYWWLGWFGGTPILGNISSNVLLIIKSTYSNQPLLPTAAPPNSTCALMRWSTPWLYNQIGSFQPWHEGTGRHDEDHITDRNGRHVRRNPTFLQPIDSTRSNAIYLSNNDHRRTMEKRESDGRTLWRVGPLKIARWRSRTRPPQTSLESCQGLTRAGITGMINDQWPCNRDLN